MGGGWVGNVVGVLSQESNFPEEGCIWVSVSVCAVFVGILWELVGVWGVMGGV